MATHPTSRWRKVRDHLRWRGAFIVALHTLRKILSPLVYWDVWHIYETDISKQVPQPYARDEFATRICGLAENPDSLAAMIASLGELAPKEVASRLTRGHLAAVAFSGGQPVGYMWLAFSSVPEELFDSSWVIGPGEAVRYNSFVIPRFRGRGVHSLLNTAVNCYARGHGIVKTIGAVSMLNPQSLSLPKHYNRPVKMTVFFAKVRGINWTIRKSFGSPLESRFSWPTQKKNCLFADKNQQPSA
jgi:GNAT superfamily N-acetyltransferase